MKFYDLKVGSTVIKFDINGTSFVTIKEITFKSIKFSDKKEYVFTEYDGNMLNTTVIGNEENGVFYTTDVRIISSNYDVFNLTKKYFGIYEEGVSEKDLFANRNFRWYRNKMHTFKFINGKWEIQKKIMKIPSNCTVLNYRQFMEMKRK